jgi:hypothetical protein
MRLENKTTENELCGKCSLHGRLERFLQNFTQSKLKIDVLLVHIFVVVVVVQILNYCSSLPSISVYECICLAVDGNRRFRRTCYNQQTLQNIMRYSSLSLICSYHSVFYVSDHEYKKTTKSHKFVKRITDSNKLGWSIENKLENWNQSVPTADSISTGKQFLMCF